MAKDDSLFIDKNWAVIFIRPLYLQVKIEHNSTTQGGAGFCHSYLELFKDQLVASHSSKIVKEQS